ncbi:class I adenylate-forming enzyme family protein [Aeromicrobium sp. 50.2.37]|uniref:class I adenylate-forming enzyme family protein n=1 Tax=Aeromicrobium sp. 50.2.37 TaxID=2969305 RepID=UPI0021502812|nr:AMP-binding protein [Aeromicrobium sp. 50.2.37]MCR4514126.1 AMP-binding protein [Aeromicrobium sp. 50.2.37]
MNLWSAFRRSLARGGDRPALSTPGLTWSHRELGAAAGHVAGLLAAHGVGAGDRVALLLGNGPGFVAADLAIMARGAVKTPLNMMMAPAEVGRALAFVEPVVVVVDAEGRERCSDVPAGTAVVELAPGWVADVGAGDVLPGPVDVTLADPAAIYLSSGTTGRPKGIVHSQDTVLHNLWAHLLDAGIDADSHLLLTTPLPHSAGLFTEAALLGGAHVRVEPRFDAERWVALVDEHEVTWSYGVPTMVKRILDVAERDGWAPTSMRTFQYGSAPMSPGLLRRALDVLGPVLQQLYAQTECPQYATLLRKSDHVLASDRPELLASAGRASTMCEVSVRGPDGAALPAGEVGEVCLRSPYVMVGYWRDPEGFSERFHGDWLRTGDIGRLDADEYLFLVDRLADMVVSGGMNVFGIEVEAALSLHPGVAQAAVIGVPDDEWGERVHAVVVPRGQVEIAELEDHCRQHLAAYKRPKDYAIVESLPLTPYGKVDKKAIRAPHWAGADRAVN